MCTPWQGIFLKKSYCPIPKHEDCRCSIGTKLKLWERLLSADDPQFFFNAQNVDVTIWSQDQNSPARCNFNIYDYSFLNISSVITAVNETLVRHNSYANTARKLCSSLN